MIQMMQQIDPYTPCSNITPLFPAFLPFQMKISMGSFQVGMAQGTPRTPFPKVPGIFSLPNSPRNIVYYSLNSPRSPPLLLTYDSRKSNFLEY